MQARTGGKLRVLISLGWAPIEGEREGYTYSGVGAIMVFGGRSVGTGWSRRMGYVGDSRVIYTSSSS